MPENPKLKKLNSKMSDKLQDYSDNLVGKVSQELAFDEEIIQIAQRFRAVCWTDIKHTLSIEKLFWCKLRYKKQ